MAVVTGRFSRLNTFSITACSPGAMTPALPPAMTEARMSLVVILSRGLSGMPRSPISTLEIDSSSHTRGPRILLKTPIGRTQKMAFFSGLFIDRRFGKRSEKITKARVISRKEVTNPALSAAASGST